MSRVMAWDPEFGGPHGRAMKRVMPPGEFTRAEKEMVASAVSSVNACNYTKIADTLQLEPDMGDIAPVEWSPEPGGAAP